MQNQIGRKVSACTCLGMALFTISAFSCLFYRCMGCFCP
nr:MAG TPA: hypothetical protein [Caudoviricetes sp.]